MTLFIIFLGSRKEAGRDANNQWNKFPEKKLTNIFNQEPTLCQALCWVYLHDPHWSSQHAYRVEKNCPRWGWENNLPKSIHLRSDDSSVSQFWSLYFFSPRIGIKNAASFSDSRRIGSSIKKQICDNGGEGKCRCFCRVICVIVKLWTKIINCKEGKVKSSTGSWEGKGFKITSVVTYSWEPAREKGRKPYSTV